MSAVKATVTTKFKGQRQMSLAPLFSLRFQVVFDLLTINAYLGRL